MNGEYLQYDMSDLTKDPSHVRMLSIGESLDGVRIAPGAQTILAIGVVWLSLWAVKHYAQRKNEKKEGK